MDTRVYFKKNGESGKNNEGEFPSIMTGSFNPHTFGRFCKQSRPRSGSSCKSFLIRVHSVCLWKYDISDLTLVDLTCNFFVLCTNMKVYLQEVFRVYLNKLENVVSFLFLVIFGNN